MSTDRSAYWRARNERVRLAKAAAKASASANGLYQSLQHCHSLSDDELIEAFAKYNTTTEPVRYFDYSPLISEDAPPYTDEDEAADQLKQLENWAGVQRIRLFALGVSAYVETLTETQILTQLRTLAPTEWNDQTSTRYVQLATLRRELQGHLARKEPNA